MVEIENSERLQKKSLKYLSYLSRNGYVVLASQYRGNDGGQGQEEFGGADVNDVLNLMPLARSLSFADAKNTVILGFSRGGHDDFTRYQKRN